MKCFWSIVMLVVGIQLFAQDKAEDKEFPYTFTEVYKTDYSETKNQCQTGTCWSFATTSFIESEIVRFGNDPVDVSEMFNVRMTYPKKAEMYFRYHGKYQFGAGSLSHDVMRSIDEHGIVPESEYMGRENADEDYDHGEMDAVLKGMMDAVIKNGKPTSQWKESVDAVLDVYLGEAPATFKMDGKSYSPIEYKEKLGIKVEDYYNISSFTHHPFYKEFVLEVPDNFSQGSFQNIPVKDLSKTVKHALENGYSVAWDADVSEQGFSFKNGMAIMPADRKLKRAKLFKEIVPEMEVTQKKRQDAFDDLTTTDDHLMHIVGLSKDQNGTEYFLIKNSWGDGNDYGGLQYVSIPYFEMKTISILLHKDAVPSDVMKKMK